MARQDIEWGERNEEKAKRARVQGEMQQFSLNYASLSPMIIRISSMIIYFNSDLLISLLLSYRQQSLSMVERTCPVSRWRPGLTQKSLPFIIVLLDCSFLFIYLFNKQREFDEKVKNTQWKLETSLIPAQGESNKRPKRFSVKSYNLFLFLK